MSGEASHEVVSHGIQVLINLEHRGACGCDPETGDGAGLLVQIPDAFLRRELAGQGVELPAPGAYAVGMIFLDSDEQVAARQAVRLESFVQAEGQGVLAGATCRSTPRPSAGWPGRACRGCGSSSWRPGAPRPATSRPSSASST